MFTVHQGMSPRSRHPGRALVVVIVVLLALILIAVVVTTVTATLGHIQGEEFCPDRFTRREFEYYEVPLIGVKITPTNYTATTNALESYLATANLVSSTASKSTIRWEIVTARRANQNEFMVGNAKILCSYLDTNNDEGSSAWMKWSQSHPQAAKSVWPAIGFLAREGLYEFIPDVFSLARSLEDSSVEEAKRSVTTLLAEKLGEYGGAQQQLGNHRVAVKLFSESLTRNENQPKLLRRRGQSFTALGQPEKALADEKLATELENAGTTVDDEPRLETTTNKS